MHSQPRSAPATGFRRLCALWLVCASLAASGQESTPNTVTADVEEADIEALVEADIPPAVPEIPLYSSRSARDQQLLSRQGQDAAHWLNTPQGPVLALYRSAETRSAQGALLILHTAEHPPGWPSPLDQLRRQLPLHGWATLAVNLADQSPPPVPPRSFSSPSPVADDGETTEEPVIPEATSAPDRGTLIAAHLDAALEFLNEEGQWNLVVLVDNSAAKAVINHLTPALQNSAQSRAPTTGESPLAGPIRAVILVNLHTQQRLTPEVLREIFAVPELPVLDIFMPPENPGQAQQRREHRAAAMRAGVRQYQSLLLAGPSLHETGNPQHFWSQRIRGFMQRQALGVELPNQAQTTP